MAGTGPDMTDQPSGGFVRHLPLIAILAVAVVGFFTLRDYLTFDTLAANREALIGYRDAHYLATALVFVGIYTVIVTFSLPGAAIASITGGFLFGMFPGVPLNLLAATTGAVAIFLAAALGPWCPP